MHPNSPSSQSSNRPQDPILQRKSTNLEIRHFRELPRNHQTLLRRFQETGWGTVENLIVREGQPILPGLRIRKTIRLKSRDRSPSLQKGDFVLKDEHIEFLQILREMGNGCIARIEVRDGLPAEVSMEEIA